MARSHYDVLGVSTNATQDEIKKAYRGLARKLHPDVNKAPDAAKKFAEVQAAYDVLSDPARKQRYDRHGDDSPEPPHAHRPHGPNHSGRARSGRYTWTNVAGTHGSHVDLDDEDLGSVFDAIFGGGAGRAGGRSQRTHRQPEPEPVVHDVRVPFLVAAKGGAQQLRVESADGSPRTIEVRIPAGIDDGATLRMKGALHGEDLHIRIHVMPHEYWRRGEGPDTGKGLDLWLDLPLTIAEATLGGHVDVPTLRGAVSLRIPHGTPSGKKFRLRGQGITAEDGRTGDLVAVALVVPPESAELSRDETELLHRIAGSGERLRRSRGLNT
ncbi:MAG TPA: DnaJ C-terminal domain-containing protein [Phycisphaerales bacterium]|nr:DnaJ C-terminal domain-containing protein [Phycisphaerales bacterium]